MQNSITTYIVPKQIKLILKISFCLIVIYSQKIYLVKILLFCLSYTDTF